MWKDLPLDQVIERQVEPYGAWRVELSGPAVSPAGEMVQPLALVFHELAANAETYGALSRPEGRLGVRWAENPGREAVDLTWSERGGPPPAAARTRASAPR